MRSNKVCSDFTPVEYGLILLTFIICLIGALQFSVYLCPDERGRKLLTDWISLHKALPTGEEPETIMRIWGFSYALRPYLSSIIGALFMLLFVQFTESPVILLAASRMGSALALSGCGYYCLRLGHRIFQKRSSAMLLATMVCLLPQAVFLGSYLNNDILGLFAVCAMLCYMVEAYDDRCSVKSCIRLAVACSMGLLSYYAVYGWILMSFLFCLAAAAFDRKLPDRGRLILTRSALIGSICLVLAGWFFIRNAILHQGDPLGLAAEGVSRARMREMGYTLQDYVCCQDDGMTLLQFLQWKDYEWCWMTARSFVGVFGGMTIYLPTERYGLYYIWFLGGMMLFFAVLRRQRPKRRDALLMIAMLLASIITVGLHLWHSYARDYQPQGRYVISLILPLGFMLSYGLDRVSVGLNGKDGGIIPMDPAISLIALWMLMFLRSALETMSKMLV